MGRNVFVYRTQARHIQVSIAMNNCQILIYLSDDVLLRTGAENQLLP